MFSQRSCGVLGPLATRKSADRFTRAQSGGPVRPSCQAITIGKATSSICRSPKTGSPSSREFCGNEPSGRCW